VATIMTDHSQRGSLDSGSIPQNALNGPPLDPHHDDYGPQNALNGPPLDPNDGDDDDDDPDDNQSIGFDLAADISEPEPVESKFTVVFFICAALHAAF
jgi:hypothetical protein